MRSASCRRGFTILELLIVMAIITVLLSVLLVGVMKGFSVAENVEDYTEVMNLTAAVTAFCSDPKFGAPGYIPSRLDPSGKDPLSANYLRRVFPGTGGILRLESAPLEGSQVLVLMLGGVSQGEGGPDFGAGWSSDPTDPTATHGQRIKFYNFDAKRRKPVHGNIYPSYEDRHGTPIAYFSPKRLDTAESNYMKAVSDCATIGAAPYFGVNLNTFQIISAGPDKRFGKKGDAWTPANAPFIYPRNDPGHDDVANFGKQLGTR